jgi:hypothetical protein
MNNVFWPRSPYGAGKVSRTRAHDDGCGHGIDLARDATEHLGRLPERRDGAPRPPDIAPRCPYRITNGAGLVSAIE